MAAPGSGFDQNSSFMQKETSKPDNKRKFSTDFEHSLKLVASTDDDSFSMSKKCENSLLLGRTAPASTEDIQQTAFGHHNYGAFNTSSSLNRKSEISAKARFVNHNSWRSKHFSIESTLNFFFKMEFRLLT